MDNFYNNSDHIEALIGEVNYLTNNKYYYLLGDEAPLIYVKGKCYYFAKAVSSIIPGSNLYVIINPLHIIIEAYENYYDAFGMVTSDRKDDYRDAVIFDLNNKENLKLLKLFLTTDYDDKYFMPVLMKVVEEADNNVRLARIKGK